MNTLSPPFVELAFAVHPGTGPAVTQILAGKEVVLRGKGAKAQVPVPDIVGISEGVERVEVAWSSIAVLAEAEPDGNPYSSDEAVALRRRVCTRFTEIAGQINFIYAAILVEESLESAEKLVASNDGSYAFRTFALSASSFDDHIVESVLQLLPEAYSEQFDWGWFISSARNMMPVSASQTGLSYDDGIERSLSISALLASAIRHRS